MPKDGEKANPKESTEWNIPKELSLPLGASHMTKVIMTSKKNTEIGDQNRRNGPARNQ